LSMCMAASRGWEHFSSRFIPDQIAGLSSGPDGVLASNAATAYRLCRRQVAGPANRCSFS
jgi:hypothetical protein